MITKEAIKLLLFSGGSAILFSSVLGLLMLLPMQKEHPKEAANPTIIFKHIGAAHIDWIMLGLMLGLAAALIQLFEITPKPFAVYCLVFGAWMNPLPYVFRAFGINAFRFGGSVVQRFAAALGLTSSLAIVYGWIHLLMAAWTIGL